MNFFKNRLASGTEQMGLWLGIPDATAAEICAQANFDWLLIDAEHAPFSLEKVQELLRTLAPYSTTAPIVRPVSDDPHLIKQYLDIGAQTLLVPMINSAEQARRVVSSVHYPPKGYRGVGTSLARASRWNSIPDYIHNCHEDLCLLLQIETIDGLNNLDSILEVPDVDGIFIGPSDLSAALGHLGNPGHPDVVEAIEGALGKIHDAGKRSGILSLNEESIGHYLALGVSFIGIGVDTLLLGNAAKHLISKYRKNNSENAPPPQDTY